MKLAPSFFVVAILSGARAMAAETIYPTIAESYEHDSSAFTEGLVLQGEWLFESTGLFGASTLRQVNRRTGAVIHSVSLPDDEFGEGLALVGRRLIQLTYENGIAHVYDAEDLRELRQFQYSGQGWGLCYDGRRLIMSDGTDRLVFRDPNTFDVVGGINVREYGQAYSQLNELECVGGEVFANVWETSFIVRIDPDTGEVLSKVSTSGLLSDEEAVGVDDLNGIAFDPATKRFLVTGKRWPKLFELELPITIREASPERTSCAFAASSFTSDRWWPTVGLLTILVLRRRHRIAASRMNSLGH